jgi:diadenosine tetraphosphate (Ap4A) HIT family hydrolase
MTTCVFCAIVGDPTNATRIREFRHSVALVNFEQDDYPGYSLLLLKEHYDHVHHISSAVLHAFIDERSQLAVAIMKAYPATLRMNYANLGNIVSHVHEHLIPRRPDDPNAGAPPWPLRSQRRGDDKYYREVAARIRGALM